MLLAALEDDQTATAHTIGASDPTLSLDRPALVGALLAMEQVLQANDMESMSAMGELQQLFGEALGDEMVSLEADMAFDKALPLCIALREKYAA